MLHTTSWLRLLLGALVLTCVSVITWIRYQLKKESLYKERKNEVERLAKDAELHTLRQQLQPHFLFNSLNSISALIHVEPAAAKNMVHQLADFLRGTLRRDQKQLLPVSDEIEHVKLYLDIEKIRFSNRLKVIMDLPEACESMKIPALLLQPAIENAIKFGLYNTTETVEIAIRCSCNKSELTVSISNPFNPETLSKKTGTGFGIQSIRRRLQLLYNRTDLVTINTENSVYQITIIIPQNP